MNEVTILKQKKGIATLIAFAGKVYSLNATAKLPKGAKLNSGDDVYKIVYDVSSESMVVPEYVSE